MLEASIEAVTCDALGLASSKSIVPEKRVKWPRTGAVGGGVLVGVGVLTGGAQGSRGEREDAGGPAIAEMVRAAGWQVAEQAVVPDEAASIAERLREWADGARLDVVLTTGGTG